QNRKVGDATACNCRSSCWAFNCFAGSLRSIEYRKILVSTAFMKLVATQPRSLRVEGRLLPEALDGFPGLPSRFVRLLFQGLHHQTDAAGSREIQPFIRFKN